MQLLAQFKKNSVHGVQSHLTFLGSLFDTMIVQSSAKE